MPSLDEPADIFTAGIVSDRFDWYACTVNASVDRLKALLADEIGGVWEPLAGARHGYHNSEGLRGLDGNIAVRMLHGGNGDLPHVWASGDDCDEFVRVIRFYYPDRHKVTRMDAAFDFDAGPGTWETLLDIHTDIAKGKRVEGDERKRASKVRTNQMGDWVHGEKGRTFYLGSFKSAVLVRLYEKGIQLREVPGSTQRHDVSVNLVRMECQVRPDGAAKEKAAIATPLEAFGYAEWSRELMRRVQGSNVERVHIRERRDPDEERSLNWMAKQYERQLLALRTRLGSWEAVGLDIRRRIELANLDDHTDDERPF